MQMDGFADDQELFTDIQVCFFVSFASRVRAEPGPALLRRFSSVQARTRKHAQDAALDGEHSFSQQDTTLLNTFTMVVGYQFRKHDIFNRRIGPKRVLSLRYFRRFSNSTAVLQQSPESWEEEGAQEDSQSSLGYKISIQNQKWKSNLSSEQRQVHCVSLTDN
jgi:hypothetical protein